MAALATCSVSAEQHPSPAGDPPASVELDRGRFRLDWVQDRTELVGTADVDAYYGILSHVREVEPAELREEADRFLRSQWKNSQFADLPFEEFPLFYDMIQNPEAYRGRPVTLTGHIQLHLVRHDAREHGLDPIHEAYLYTEDSQRHPATIVFTENPDEIPAGEQTLSGISVTGYFLKLYPYASRDGKGRYAPLILARAIRWTPPRPATLSKASQFAIVAGLLGIVASIVFWMRRIRASDRRSREREEKLLGRDEPPDFASLEA
jgi:hypothetical protein